MTDDLLQALQDSLRDRGVPIRTTPPVIVADRETAEALHPMVGRTYPDVETALDALVAASGGTLSGVAEILAAAGIRGFCTDANRCALAQWLLTVVDGDLRGDVEVQPCDGEVGEVSWGDVEIFSCTLPPLLNRFASAFDEGRYPALIHEDSAQPTELVEEWVDGDRLLAPGGTSSRDGDPLYGTVIDGGTRVKWDGINGSDTVEVARGYFEARRIETGDGS